MAVPAPMQTLSANSQSSTGALPTLLQIGRHHAALDVVAAEPERHLCEVVRADAEEVRHLGDLVRH